MTNEKQSAFHVLNSDTIKSVVNAINETILFTVESDYSIAAKFYPQNLWHFNLKL